MLWKVEAHSSWRLVECSAALSCSSYVMLASPQSSAPPLQHDSALLPAPPPLQLPDRRNTGEGGGCSPSAHAQFLTGSFHPKTHICGDLSRRHVSERSGRETPECGVSLSGNDFLSLLLRKSVSALDDSWLTKLANATGRGHVFFEVLSDTVVKYLC